MLTQAPVNISVTNFTGAVKLVDSRLLPNNVATEAINCELESGTIKSIKAPFKIKNAGLSTGTLFVDNNIIYEFSGDCDVISSPVGDTVGRFYFTDGVSPKKTSRSIYPSTRSLGVTAPSSPITASGPNLSGQTIVATVSYIYTYVTDWGEESAPSPASAVFEIYNKIDVNLSGIQNYTGSDQHVSKKRIYRLAVGNNGADYQFLAEIGGTTTTYRDQSRNSDLGDVCPTQTWIGPQNDLKGLIYIGNGYTAGFRANEVYISEPFVPYAYPLANMFSFDTKVVGLGVFGQTLVVCTGDKIGVLYGADPRSVTQDSIPESYPCISKSSIVSMSDSVIFASRRGLVRCSGQGVQFLTRDIWSELDWARLHPEKLIGVAYKGCYYGFIKDTNKGFILDFANSTGGDKYPTIVELDLSGFMPGGIINAVSDGENNKIYLLTIHNGLKSIYEYAASLTDLTFKWESKTFSFDQHINPGAAMLSMNGSVSFRVNNHSVNLTSNGNTRLRLSAGSKDYELLFGITGTGEVRRVDIADSIRGLNGAG